VLNSLSIQELEQQLEVLASACLLHDSQIVKLQAQLWELEPYRNFVEQMRLRVLLGEHDI